MEEDKEYRDLPEETKEQVIDKISIIAFNISLDYNDPKGQCKKIIELCCRLIEFK